MDWPLVIAWALFACGLIAGGFIFARSPKFWVGFGLHVFGRLWPHIWAFVSKRKSAEDEADWRHDQLTKPNPGVMPSKFPKRDR